MVKTTLKVFSVCPSAFGGLVVQIPSYFYRKKILSSLHTLLPEGTVFSPMPLGLKSDQLHSQIDMLDSLVKGEHIIRKGIFDREKFDQLLIFNLIKNLEKNVSSCICSEIDKEDQQKSKGLKSNFFIFFEEKCTDDSDEEKLSWSIRDRIALNLLLNDVVDAFNKDEISIDTSDVLEVQTAKKIFNEVVTEEPQLNFLLETAKILSVEGFRPIFFTLSVSRALAALGERRVVSQEDLELAISLSLFPKAKSLPDYSRHSEEELQKENVDNSSHEESQDISSSQDNASENDSEKQVDLNEERETESVEAFLQESILNEFLKKEYVQRVSSNSENGNGQGLNESSLSGKGYRSINWRPGASNHIKIIESIQAAIPHQSQRIKLLKNRKKMRIYVLPNDLKVVKRRKKTRNTTVFLVDASGSSASRRLGEAKGAVELLLSQCYIRRDEVALISFKGKKSELLLAPTRSLVRAKKCLLGLRGGGGTPMSMALEHAFNVCNFEYSQGKIPALVVLSDGGANVTKDGIGNRKQAYEEAVIVARLFKNSGIKSIFIDIAENPLIQTKHLADIVGSTYVALPKANSKRIVDIVNTS